MIISSFNLKPIEVHIVDTERLQSIRHHLFRSIINYQYQNSEHNNMEGPLPPYHHLSIVEICISISMKYVICKLQAWCRGLWNGTIQTADLARCRGHWLASPYET